MTLLRCILALVLFGSAASAADYEYKLFFGLSKPGGGAVSMAEWQAYEAEFARAFSGFNVDETVGFYQAKKERSRIITVFMDECREPKLHGIIRQYVDRFGQDSVLLSKTPIASWTLVGRNDIAEMDDQCSVRQDSDTETAP